jgi:hypothetical protein
MKILVLLTSVAAFSLAAGIASAATLKNTDKEPVSVTVENAGKSETVSIKPNESYDSKGKDVTFTLGKEKPVVAKAADNFMIKGGKIEAQMATATLMEKTVKTETSTTAIKAVPVDAAAGK